ncbi:MAG: flagellar hook-length control protein FliK, partial [Leptospiraceae bacterium]|nr:flagellar hook-length control protein FliK [Leptospiraceae bacterium]
ESASDGKGLLQRITSVDSEAVNKLKEFFKNHPELEKAAQSVRSEKDLQAFIKRLTEELPAKDLTQLRELVQKVAPIEQLANGNVRINSDKWTVDGPVLSSQMKVQTEEKTSTQSHSKNGGEQQKSDSQLNMRMDSTILAQKNRASATANEAPAFDRKQFQEMVEQARVRLSADGKSTASIRMNPENLGRMHLDLVMKDNVLSGRLLVENHAAFKHIKDEIEGLRAELAKHGIQLEGLSVKTRETVQSQMGHQLRQDMQGQGFSAGSENGGDAKNGSENPGDSEKYSSGSENRWEERVIADVSESLLSAIPSGRVDLSV